MPKMAAATSSTGSPRTIRPSNFVNNTDTSTGTRKMRATESEFGKFMALGRHDRRRGGLPSFYAPVV
jgi:hypothetical protein